jgi:quercetin dioxygenase-like cupin family protein
VASIAAVETLRFGAERAHAIDAFGSEGVTMAPLTEPTGRGAQVQAACFRLEPGGRIGRHPASVPQLLAVVAGSGWASGADGVPQPLGSGDAVFWEAGEEHETGTDDGLTAIVLEGESLLPFRRG